MSVETVNSVISYVVAAGSSVLPYTFNFKVLSADTVVVTHIDTDGVKTVLDPATYTVTGLGLDSGTVTLDAPAAEGTLIIERIEPYTTSTIIIEGSSFPATAIRTITDRLAMMIQQLKERTDRSIFSCEESGSTTGAICTIFLSHLTSRSIEALNLNGGFYIGSSFYIARRIVYLSTTQVKIEYCDLTGVGGAFTWTNTDATAINIAVSY